MKSKFVIEHANGRFKDWGLGGDNLKDAIEAVQTAFNDYQSAMADEIFKTMFSDEGLEASFFAFEENRTLNIHCAISDNSNVFASVSIDLKSILNDCLSSDHELLAKTLIDFIRENNLHKLDK